MPRLRDRGELLRDEYVMPYLIDGNNVMAQVVGWHRNKPAARKKLIVDLAAFVAKHHVRVQVVFDGIPDEEFPEGRKYKSVLVRYARQGSDADSRIKEMIRRSSYRRDLVVVSSDRDLISFAGKQGTKVMPSGKFREMLEETKSAGLTREKVGMGDPIDVDDWLDFFGKSGN